MVALRMMRELRRPRRFQRQDDVQQPWTRHGHNIEQQEQTWNGHLGVDQPLHQDVRFPPEVGAPTPMMVARLMPMLTAPKPTVTETRAP